MTDGAYSPTREIALNLSHFPHQDVEQWLRSPMVEPPSYAKQNPMLDVPERERQGGEEERST